MLAGQRLVLAVPTCQDTADALDVVSLLLDYGSGNRASSRCCPGMTSLQKKSAGCRMEAKRGRGCLSLQTIRREIGVPDRLRSGESRQIVWLAVQTWTALLEEVRWIPSTRKPRQVPKKKQCIESGVKQARLKQQKWSGRRDSIKRNL